MTRARALQLGGVLCLMIAAVVLVATYPQGPVWALGPLAVGLALLVAYDRERSKPEPVRPPQEPSAGG